MEDGLDFKEFAIIVWNFCTLSPFHMAKMIFEIFDIEMINELERADIEAMYRFMYDCDDHDEFYVAQVPYDNEGNISKQEFASFVSKRKHIIQPALDYQLRLRKKMGGFIMWEGLAGFRRRMFLVYDEQSATMEEALLAIVASEDPNKVQRKLDADRLLKEKAEAMAAEANKAAEELRAIQRAKEDKRRQDELTAEDRFMKLYWVALEQKRLDFENKEFFLTDAEERYEERMEIYNILDKYIIAQNEFWEARDQKELDTMIGEKDDHDARYRDYVKQNEGKLQFQSEALRFAFNAKLKQLEAERNAKKVVPAKTQKEFEIENASAELDKKEEVIARNHMLISAGALKSKVKAQQIRPVNFNDENTLARKVCKKDEIKAAELAAHDIIWEEVKEKATKHAHNHVNKIQTERKNDLIRVEFELATSYGSRITAWEYLMDRKQDKYVWYNRSTQEIMHQKTAICEYCDYIFEQSDVLCKQCNPERPRSMKNQLLYRPLGFKDIRVD